MPLIANGLLSFDLKKSEVKEGGKRARRWCDNH